MTTEGYFSIVAHKDRKGYVLVRARRKEHLVALRKKYGMSLRDVRIQSTPKADYPYRIMVWKSQIARIMNDAVERIDYHNFKDEIKEDKDYHEFLFDTWYASQRMTRA